MNRVITIFALIASVYLGVVSASDEYKAVLDIIKQGYEDSLTKLTDGQRNDLREFKQILSKTSKVSVDDPMVQISDDVLVKKINKYLEQKVGSYQEGAERETKFMGDCNKYLAEPCEQLRSSFKLSMALYYARFSNKKFVDMVKSERESYDQLETAGICETLLKATDKICTKSFNHLANHKSSKAFFGKLKTKFIKGKH